jgi:hypothetical protein
VDKEEAADAAEDAAEERSSYASTWGPCLLVATMANGGQPGARHPTEGGSHERARATHGIATATVKPVDESRTTAVW